MRFHRGLLPVAFFFALCATLSAEDAGSAKSEFFVLPVRQTIIVSTGGVQGGLYQVTSTSDRPLEMTVATRDWRSGEANRGIAVEEWLTVSPNAFTLEPRASREISFQVRVPTAARNELSAMITFIPKPKEGQQINLVIGASLYVRIAGQYRLEGEIKSMKLVTGPGAKHPSRVAVLVRNNGNAHIRPEGGFSIRKKKDVIQAFPMQAGHPVYPQSENAYFGDWTVDLLPGKYVLEARMRFSQEMPEIVKTSKLKVNKDGSMELVD